MLAQAKERPRLEVPQADPRLGLRGETPRIKQANSDPHEVATKLVAQLEAFPDDNQTREELALLYLEGFQRPDLALEQFEQLIGQTLAPSAQVVKWLNLVADIQVSSTGDLARARETVQRILDRYPGTPAAETARRRLLLLERELQAKKQSQVVKLGSYEQRLGLKNGRP
jgi:tetratricopeptide (TPR) repeat protein